MVMFEIGDRVIYTSGRHEDFDMNPLWGGNQGNIVGTILDFENDYDGARWMRVLWDNREENTYEDEDLELYFQPIMLDDSLFED
jgi:hypothetical protein